MGWGFSMNSTSARWTTWLAWGNSRLLPQWSSCRWVLTTSETRLASTPWEARASSMYMGSSPVSSVKAGGVTKSSRPVSTMTSDSPWRSKNDHMGSQMGLP